MEERVGFVLACTADVFTMSELCAEYGISRKTGYKWLSRYGQAEPGDFSVLADRSRAPHSCAHSTPEEMCAALIALRRQHPRWGARKLLADLARRQPELVERVGRLPAASTATQVLKRASLVRARRGRVRTPHAGAGSLQASAPNQVWCTDFKGEFATGDGVLCYPLTVTDAYSRMLLACQALRSTQHTTTQQTFARLFAEVGLPDAIRSDNGGPFASTALSGLSRLSVWWLKLGIVPQRIRRGRPQENGRHERMHRTLKAETARPPQADLLQQQARFDTFRQEFNHERPHEALGQQTPASVWVPAPRSLPLRVPEPEYAGHFQVRRVRSCGQIKWRGQLLFVSEVLAGEAVGLEEVDEGLWSLYFCGKLLGRVDERGAQRHSVRASNSARAAEANSLRLVPIERCAGAALGPVGPAGRRQAR